MVTIRIGTALLAGVMAIGACGLEGDTDEQGAEVEGPSTSSASNSGASISTPADDEGAVPVSTNEAGGTVTGGRVERSYPGSTYPQELTAIIESAIADLVTSLDVDAGMVNVVGVDEVTWSDAGLGCPEPGMAYAQVLTDGLRIVLEAGGQTYDYRSGGTTEPRRCEAGRSAAAEKSATTTTISVDPDGATTIVTTSTGSLASIVTKPTVEEKGPTEGIDPPDE